MVQAKLELEWSPEQISGWLRLTHPDRPSWQICHETIYQALYQGHRGALSRELTKRLRTGRPLRKRRRRTHERSPRFIAPAQLIDQRPEAAHLREDVGHWEGDLIVGMASRSAIGTVVDRHSRYLKLVHLPIDHTASSLTAAMTITMGGLASSARSTLTWDQGSEMSSHDKVAELFAEGVFFAHAGKPWQRGLNENTNGLLRQYFPKRSDLSRHSAADLEAVEERLNNRPRKALGWLTPAQVFTASLASD